MKKIAEMIMDTAAYAAAAAQNYRGALEIVNEMQNAWDEGAEFVMDGGMEWMCARRDGDSAEEIAVCLSQAEKSLCWFAIREQIGWLTERDARGLESALRILGATLNMNGETVHADDVRKIWNEKNEKI